MYSGRRRPLTFYGPNLRRARRALNNSTGKIWNWKKNSKLQTQFVDPLCLWQCFHSNLPDGEICINRLEEGGTLTSLWKMQVKAKAVSLKNSSRFAQMFHCCNIKMASFNIEFASKFKTIPRCVLNVTTTFVTGAASSFSRIMSWNVAFFVENHEMAKWWMIIEIPATQDQDNQWVMIKYCK